uniref:Uncharacterized protein n=1 Tax=Panagrolaimus superbus TaxID=310955 RepID=A0A914YPZ9_9BILA
MIFFACESPLERFENGKPQTVQSKALRQFLEDMEPVTGSFEIICSLAAALHHYFSEQFKFELSSDFTELTEIEVQGGVSSNRACESVFGFVDLSL